MSKKEVFKRACRNVEKCSANKKHKWYLGVTQTYNFDVNNIKYIVHKYFHHQLVYPISIK